MSTVSTFFGLNPALKGLIAHQRALDVTAHNIGNASTEGYTRQTASLAAVDPMQIQGEGRTGLVQLGAGVTVESFARLRDQFADLQYRAQNQALGQHEANAQLIGQAELGLAEPSDNGIGALLNKFWNAWDNVANHPDQPATRQALVNQAALLSTRIGELSKSLSDVRAEAGSQYTSIVGPNGDVQALANDIAQLNTAIKSITGSGG